MERCFELAKKGHPLTYPNPLVGSVIVHKEKIIGEGYHTGYGHSHAEVEAIAAVKDKSLLSSSTLYVNLEPCAHHGKTPPCADLIITHEIPRVVIANLDPHDKVAGKGIATLKRSGVDVTTGILEEKGAVVNRRFMTFHSQSRPYIVLKWAETADRFMGRDPNDSNQAKSISNAVANLYVHQLRAESGAIFVGTNTAIEDNPSLTTRLVYGTNPLRILLDVEGKVPATHNLLADGYPTVVIGKKRKGVNVEFEQLLAEDSIFDTINKVLLLRNIDQVLIEGGANILTQCIAQNYWDEMHVIQSQDHWGIGTKAPELPKLKATNEFTLQDNLVHVYHNK